VVRKGHSRHVVFGGCLDKIPDPAGPIQQTVVGMIMEMNKLSVHLLFSGGKTTSWLSVLDNQEAFRW
jgi:hypothetical protein